MEMSHGPLGGNQEHRVATALTVRITPSASMLWIAELLIMIMLIMSTSTMTHCKEQSSMINVLIDYNGMDLINPFIYQP
eukprot:scaffold382771_cov16-Prasinocladus_malaysianus.AAC.1